MKFKIQLMKPAEDFLSKLETKLKAKAFRTIELLGEFGNELREPFSKKIQGYEGFFELRIKYSSDICRFFYFFEKDKKTNQNELDNASKLMKAYREKRDER